MVLSEEGCFSQMTVAISSPSEGIRHEQVSVNRLAFEFAASNQQQLSCMCKPEVVFSLSKCSLLVCFGSKHREQAGITEMLTQSMIVL